MDKISNSRNNIFNKVGLRLWGHQFNYNDFPGNIMHSGVAKDASGKTIPNPNRGYSITRNQVKTIIYNIQNGIINKGNQGSDPR